MMLPPFAEWRRRRRALRELEALSDRELSELGLFRCDVPRVARENADLPRAPREAARR